jgi:c-di-GMP-related signal transduction protein
MKSTPIPSRFRTTSESESTGLTRYLGRQPILQYDRQIHGHELLFRAGPQNVFSGDEDEASRQVIDNCLLLMPEAKQALSFINCTKHTLLSGMVRLLPPATTVLEILETIEPTTELLDCIHTLRHHGYSIALDDFSPDPSRQPFIKCADYIKIDFMASNAEDRKLIYQMAAKRKIKFIAEKVETEADVKTAKAEGCELFQGYYFSKPVIVKSRVVPQNHVIYLQLLGALSRSPANINEVERLVMLDASICYRLLRLVNSALYWLPHQITSIRGALMMVGDDEMRRLVTVALTTTMAGDRPALVSMALERAKFCELLAPVVKEEPSRLYLLGMLSLMDSFLGLPMEQILSSLPLDHEMKGALLREDRSLTRVLKVIDELDQSTDDQREIQVSVGLSEDTASLMRLQSTCWADAVMYA